MEKYGEQLFIIAINTGTQEGHELYEAAMERYQFPKIRRGVPALIVGENVFVGSLEIPEQFPGILEDGLMTGGIDWPDVPGLRDLLVADGIIKLEGDPPNTEGGERKSDEPAAEDATEPQAASSDENIVPESRPVGVTTDLEQAATTSEDMTFGQRFAQDRIGNTVSVFVLFGMVLSVLGVGATFIHPRKESRRWPEWIIQVLVFIGLVVAAYMAYVEITQTEAVCGPVGDCNTVQQSSYTFLFGIIPIGALGVVGYVIIGIVWLIVSFGPAEWKRWGSLCLWGLALFGSLFSIYLTFLEPFVIGATCAWCLTSAIVMMLLLWATTVPAAQAWHDSDETASELSQ
jgi:uncharacterized membrane protein